MAGLALLTYVLFPVAEFTVSVPGEGGISNEEVIAPFEFDVSMKLTRTSSLLSANFRSAANSCVDG